MGLDMNLYRRVDVSDCMTMTGEKGERVEQVILNGQCDKTVGRSTRYQITTNVCYWRKFNALHKYMRDHFGRESEDNCVDMFLNIDDIRKLLMELKNLVKQIKLDKDGIITNQEICEEILPPEDGFFFGSTALDSYYVEDIKDTIEMLGRVIDDHAKLVEAGVDEYDISYYYNAWY